MTWLDLTCEKIFFWGVTWLDLTLKIFQWLGLTCDLENLWLAQLCTLLVERVVADRTIIMSSTVNGLRFVYLWPMTISAELNVLSIAADNARIQTIFFANFDKLANNCACSFQNSNGLSLSLPRSAWFDSFSRKYVSHFTTRTYWNC